MKKCSFCKKDQKQFIKLKCTHILCFKCYQKGCRNENEIKQCLDCNETITIFDSKNKRKEEDSLIQCGFICEDLFLPKDVIELECLHSICHICKKIYDNLLIKNKFKHNYCPYSDCTIKIGKTEQNNMTECPVCNLMIDNKNKISLECNHVVCKPCLKKSIENLSKFKETNKMGCYNCKNQISKEFLERIFHPNFIRDNFNGKAPNVSEECTNCPRCLKTNSLIEYTEYLKKKNYKIEYYEFQNFYRICEFDEEMVCKFCNSAIAEANNMKPHFLYESKYL